MSTYPVNATGQQFLFHIDGTYGQILNSNRTLDRLVTNAELSNACDWNLGTSVYSNWTGTHYINFLFPELRNLTELSFRHDRAPNSSMWISYDTTNGIDGSWIEAVTSVTMAQWVGADILKLRQIIPLNYTAVRGVEFRQPFDGNALNIYNINLFGSFVPAGVEFWHATLNQQMEGRNFDFGDVFRSASVDKTFRIKNNSAQTANNVAIAATMSISGGLQAGMKFSDGGAFVNSLNIVSISPSGLSPVITARRTIGAGETENQLGSCRISATPGSWS